MGISGKFKTPPFICVKPRQRNSGVHRCQILWFRSVPSDFTLFDQKLPVCSCLGWLEETDIEILGISGKFKTPPFICVKPRQRNSGVHRCQILCRIWFYRSRRRNSSQFRGLQFRLQRFDDSRSFYFEFSASFTEFCSWRKCLQNPGFWLVENRRGAEYRPIRSQEIIIGDSNRKSTNQKPGNNYWRFKSEIDQSEARK